MSEDPKWRNLWGARVSQPCDMPLDQLKEVVTTAKDRLSTLGPAMEPSQSMAQEMKEWCDKTYGQQWLVVIGRHFGAHAVHHARRFTFFYIGDVACMVAKI
jgi:hypothetical protein